MAGPIDALLTEWSDAFDEQIADNTRGRLDASGAYTFNIGRHIFLENGTFINDIADTAALVDLNGKMQVTADAGDEHVFGGRETIRYVPVYELLVGAAAWAEDEKRAREREQERVSDPDVCTMCGVEQDANAYVGDEGPYCVACATEAANGETIELR